MNCPHCDHALSSDRVHPERERSTTLEIYYCINRDCPVRKRREWLPDERYEKLQEIAESE